MKNSVLLVFFMPFLFLVSCKDSYFKKDGKVYYNDYKPESWTYEPKLVNADIKSFKSFGKSVFARDKNFGFYRGKPLKVADPHSFHPLSEGYAADKIQGYRGEIAIAGSDGRSMRVIDPYYCADSKNVYFESKPLNVADSRKFVLVDKQKRFWGTDGKYYYQNYRSF